MADFAFNIAKGRVIEYYNRVKSNDPANSAFIIVVLATTGLETDAVLKDVATLAALVAGTTNEVTNTGYVRKVLTDVDIAALPAPDLVNDWITVDLPDILWTGVLAGDGWSKLVICYDNDTTAGTDANIIPLAAYDFVVTPDGSDIQAVINTAGFYRAQ